METNELANQIRAARQEFKQIQREFSKTWIENEFNRNTCFYQPEKYHLLLEPLYSKIYKSQNKLIELKRKFRALHIFRSMGRRKSILQIENKTRDDKQSIKERDMVYEIVKNMLNYIGRKWVE